MVRIGHSRGLIAGAWSDSLSKVDIHHSSDLIQANVWGALFRQDHERAQQLQELGVQTVLSHLDVLHVDFPYQNAPEELGYYPASKNTGMVKIFRFMTDNTPAMANW